MGKSVKLEHKMRLESIQSAGSYNLMRDYAINLIYAGLGQLVIRSPWTAIHSGSSVCLRNTSTGTTVKITTGCEVFVDRRMKDQSFKCARHTLDSMEHTVQVFLNIMHKYLPSLEVVQ